MNSASKANDRPSLIGRGLHRGAVFLVAICIGIAGTLAWQSPGSDLSKQKMANWVRQQGWELPAKVLSPATDNAAGQPSLREAPPSRPTAATPVAPSTPTHEVPQLEAMARDLAAVRQNVEQLTRDQKQLAARQEQMAADQKQLGTSQEQMIADLKYELAAGQEQVVRQIAELQTAVQNLQNGISAAPATASKPAPQPRREAGEAAR